jgi:hypothetical protein
MYALPSVGDPGAAVLNPGLYRLLRQLFGAVSISNQGEGFHGNVVRSAASGRYNLTVRSAGEYYRVNCFAGETLVTTPIGDRPIAELVGTTTLLVPNKKGLGHWKTAEVRCFGDQHVVTLHLRRRRQIKTLRVTLDHRWLVRGRKGYVHKLTSELVSGDYLSSCFARNLASYGTYAPALSVVAVAQGFTFGDGSHEVAPGNPAMVPLFGEKDRALLPYFQGYRITTEMRGGAPTPVVKDLPRSWKRLPDADESLSFLLGWFAGYFAADGAASPTGQAVLYSANPEYLNFVKGVCYRLGVGVGPVTTRTRSCDGCVPDAADKPMYALSFRSRDLPAAFWIQDSHRQNILNAHQERREREQDHWRVEQIVDTGEVVPVFCAVVPGRELFTLADNLLTRNCPFCPDTKKHLWINHYYGQPGPDGRPYTHLAHCFKNNCLDDWNNRKTLADRLLGMVNARSGRTPFSIMPSADDGPPAAFEPPGDIQPLTQLSADHPAVQYMLSRRYTLAMLADFEIAYVVRAAPKYRAAQNRIYFPIRMRGELVGWQARYLGDVNWKATSTPKYLSMPHMKKSRMLYNFDSASRYPFVVVVEGPTDVHRLGAGSVALFGKTLSLPQRELLLHAWADKPIVFLLDPDAVDAMRGLVYELAIERRHAPVIAVELPAGADPGDWETAALWAYVHRQASLQRVQLW